ncbi:MAG: A/G-specific adenine glycosylase [Actinobacteria bacterium]|nr:A/G-specific adenine glycosylase [Actinomycetota bacterium]
MDAIAGVPPEFRRRFVRRILRWYRGHGRDLPWRRTSSPYHVAVAEILLQQTQVGRVASVYAEFIQRYPTVEALAAAPLTEIKALTDPLGYHVRGVWLKALAEQVTAAHGGQLPSALDALRRLPGLGPYAAAAVRVFGHRRRAALLDTNIARVYTRAVGLPAQGSHYQDSRRLEALAQALTPPRAFYAYHQGLMDLGATVCTARNPDCPRCPLRTVCRAVNGGPPAAVWRANGLVLAAERTVGYRAGSGPRAPRRPGDVGANGRADAHRRDRRASRVRPEGPHG